MNIKSFGIFMMFLNFSTFAFCHDEEAISEQIQGVWIQNKVETYNNFLNENSELSEALKLCIGDETCGANIFEFKDNQVSVFVASIKDNSITGYEKLGPFDFMIGISKDSRPTLMVNDGNTNEQLIRFEGGHLVFVHDYFYEFLIKIDKAKLEQLPIMIN